jgi:hypothetical protein
MSTTKHEQHVVVDVAPSATTSQPNKSRYKRAVEMWHKVFFPCCRWTGEALGKPAGCTQTCCFMLMMPVFAVLFAVDLTVLVVWLAAALPLSLPVALISLALKKGSLTRGQLAFVHWTTATKFAVSVLFCFVIVLLCVMGNGQFNGKTPCEDDSDAEGTDRNLVVA